MVRQHTLDIPVALEQLVGNNERVEDRLEHLAVVARLVVAPAQLLGQEVGRRPGKAYAPADEHVAAQGLPRG